MKTCATPANAMKRAAARAALWALAGSGAAQAAGTLTRPNAPFLANLSIPNLGAIYPAEVGQQLLKLGKLDALNTQPVGSGPFVFRSYAKDATVRYDAHAEHWGGKPLVDRMIYAITVDGDVRAQRLKAGECLVGSSMKPQSVAAFDAGGFVPSPFNNLDFRVVTVKP